MDQFYNLVSPGGCLSDFKLGWGSLGGVCLRGVIVFSYYFQLSDNF